MQRAQDTVEYALLIATVAMLVLLGATTFGSKLADWFNNLARTITGPI